MGPNWAEIAQAVAQAATVVVTLVGMIFVILQLRQVASATRGSTAERLAAQRYEVIRFMAQRPETYPYFYEDINPEETAADGTVIAFVQYATEMLANYIENVALQREHMSAETWRSWKLFIKSVYLSSPALRVFLQRDEQWYDPKLMVIIRDIEHERQRATKHAAEMG
jgi:hypothetical protein